MAERNVLLKNVKHPFLVGLHYSFQTTEKLYFVLDFVNGGEVSLVSSYFAILIPLVFLFTHLKRVLSCFYSVVGAIAGKEISILL